MEEIQELHDDVDLDLHLSQDFQDEEELEPTDDPVLAQLTAEERAVLDKVQQLQMEQDPVINMFNQLESRPTDEHIEHLKQQVGDVFLVSFSERENFLFRALKRLEWGALLKRIDKLSELKKSEAIVMKGCLYPELNQQTINALCAGTVETLKDLIIQASNFLPPEVAMNLVRKL